MYIRCTCPYQCILYMHKYFSMNTDPSRMQVTYKYILASILEGNITFVEVFLLFTVIRRGIFSIVQWMMERLKYLFKLHLPVINVATTCFSIILSILEMSTRRWWPIHIWGLPLISNTAYFHVNAYFVHLCMHLLTTGLCYSLCWKYSLCTTGQNTSNDSWHFCRISEQFKVLKGPSLDPWKCYTTQGLCTSENSH